MPNNIFLLEVIAYRVTLTDRDQEINTCPVCVCFHFPGLVEMDVCEGDVCETSSGGGEINMTRGKSCLFAIGAESLCRAARDFCAVVSVYRRVDGGPETRVVAQARLEFDRTFTDIILDPDQTDRIRDLRKALSLYEKGRPKPVGTVEIFVRLTSQGKLIVTQFTKTKDGNKYQYKEFTEYVPVDVSESIKCKNKRCLEKKCCEVKCCVKKCNEIKCCVNKCNEMNCCPNKTSCETAQSREDVDSNDCRKQINQVNCILTVMEQMKDLFAKAKMPQSSGKERMTNSSSELQMDQDDAVLQNQRCMFDESCPVAACPFRIGEPSTAFVERMVDGSGLAPSPGQQSEIRPEIEDDADLMVVKVGRVDPCRTNVTVTQEGGTQYAESDIPAEYLPPPMPVKPKEKKGKSRKGSKKRGKSGKNKKK